MINLVDRVPVPGQFGVAVGATVTVHVQTTGTVLLGSLTVKINTINVVLNGAFQTGYSGTVTSDTAGGWVVTVDPSTNFSHNQIVTVRVLAQDADVAFDQSYAFQTVRNIQAAGTVRYYEEGDIIEADLYVHEAGTLVPDLLDSAVLSVRRLDTTLQRFEIQNSAKNCDAAGYFNVRLIHPPTVAPDLEWQFDVVINDEQAPGVGQVSVAGTVEMVAKNLNLAEQPSTRIGATVPRAQPTTNAVDSLRVESQPAYEVVDISKSGDASAQPSVLVDLNFLDAAQYCVKLAGDPHYTGGGSRLLGGIDDSAVLFKQDSDEFPPTFGARTVLEPACTNLLGGDLTEQTFTLETPDPLIRVDLETLDLTADGAVKELHWTVEGRIVANGQDRVLVWETERVPVSASSPVLARMLARTKLRDATVTLDTFAVRVRLFNSMNVEVYSVDHNFDVFAIESDTQMSALEALVAAGSIPGTATQASFQLRVGSWEGCDLMDLWVAAPAIEQVGFGTSPVVGTRPSTRTADRLRIDGAGNLNCRNGSITTTFVPAFEGLPPQAVTLWDTRSAGLDGYTLRWRTDGKFELSAYDTGALSHQVVGGVVNATAGTAMAVRAHWTPASLVVTMDQVVMAQFAGSYVQPTGPHATIEVGNNQSGTEPLLGELHAFMVEGS